MKAIKYKRFYKKNKDGYTYSKTLALKKKLEIKNIF